MEKQYTPIASKSFGIDDFTGLEKALFVFKQTNDAKNETIIMDYDIVLLSPNGKIVSILYSDNYTRYNMPNKNKFDELRQSQIGQAIEALIQNDLNGIQTFVSIKQDLLQTEPQQ